MFAYPISIGIDPCDTNAWLQIMCGSDINFRYLHTRHGFAYSSLSELRKFKQLSKEKKDPGKCIARSEWHRFAFLQTQIQIWMYKHLFLHRKLSFSNTLCSCSVSTFYMSLPLLRCHLDRDREIQLHARTGTGSFAEQHYCPHNLHRTIVSVLLLYRKQKTSAIVLNPGVWPSLFLLVIVSVMTREWLLHLIKILRDDTSFTMRFEVKKAKLQNRFFGRREKSSRTHSRASGYKAQNATYFSALFFDID